jgi:hypothetical protein
VNKQLKSTWLFLLLLAIFGIPSILSAQGSFGVGISYGIVNSASADLYYRSSFHQFHLGGSMQFADTRGKPQSDPSGRGSTLESTGTWFWSVDAGWGYFLSEKIPVNLIVSAGRKLSYSNFLDSSFSDGGYHTIDDRKFTVGIGADIGYNLGGLFQVFAGYHSLRSLYIGIRVTIPD